MDAGDARAVNQTDAQVKLAAGLILVAGMAHLALVGDHMSHALGAGLFFVGVGVAQVGWAFLFTQNPSPAMARIGLAAMAVAPTALYAITRVMRAPWAIGPEAVDVVGVATGVAQLGAAAMLMQAARAGPTRRSMTRVPAAAGIGVLLALGGYAGALVAEDVHWLSEAGGLHLHGDDGHAGHGDHGSHAGHSTTFAGTRGESAVGSLDYYGPTGGEAIAAHCQAVNHPDADCWLHYLNEVLLESGSVVAFDTLVELLEVVPEAASQGHTIAHALGHTAYQAYGLNVELALGECSYEVFQGCIHGVLQAYFDDLANLGIGLDRDSLGSVCSASTSSFETYTCFHGVGHGIMMYTNYDLHRSLDTCHLLPDWFAQTSCYGGVYMENAVGYIDSTRPGYEPHDHGFDEPPAYWVDASDPAYPCNVVKDRYEHSCWRMQTSLVLHFNDADFEDASRVCDDAGKHRLTCYSSLGRDAPPHAKRDPAIMSQMCSYGEWDAQEVCVTAFTAGVVLKANDPQSGLDLCPQLPDNYQAFCYREVGDQANSMIGEAESRALCERAPPSFVDTCHEGRLQ